MNALLSTSILTADPQSSVQMRQVRQIKFLARANRLLGVVVVVLAVAAAFYSWPSRNDSRSPFVSAVPSAAVDPQRKIVLAAPLTDGKTSLIRNILEAAAPSAGVDYSLQYKVVGIILDRNPQAVLKDRQSGESIFVHKGDRLGGAVVADIQDGRVVLSFEEKKIELRP